jgi:hypothetical protein
MGIVSTEEEQANWNAEEKLFGRSILIPVINLLPHIQVIVSTGVEFKWYAADVMEHEIRAEHVGYVGEGPRCFLRDPGDDVEEDFESNYEDHMDRPCT